jgi:hypothetical protein
MSRGVVKLLGKDLCGERAVEVEALGVVAVMRHGND